MYNQLLIQNGVIIETKGDKNLKEGLNVVTITLTNQDLENNNFTNETIENLINSNFTEESNVKEQTTYIINVNRKAKPVTEISSNGVENNKFVAGVILSTLIVVLLIATIVAHKKRNKTSVKTKKYKRAK